MDYCFFCDTIAGNTYMKPIRLLDSELFITVWDMNPATPGHALVIPKRHVQFMKDLNENEQEQLVKQVIAVKQFIKDAPLDKIYQELISITDEDTSRDFLRDALKTVSDPDQELQAFNDGLNDGPGAGQTVPHFHWHILPRWKNDVPDPIGGIRHMFPGKGNYKTGLKN